jgi:hypothetical protein
LGFRISACERTRTSSSDLNLEGRDLVAGGFFVGDPEDACDDPDGFVAGAGNEVDALAWAWILAEGCSWAGALGWSWPASAVNATKNATPTTATTP